MEVPRLVEILVACFVRAFAAPTSDFLVESSPLPVCVDPPQTWHVTKTALTRPDLLAIVQAQQARKPMTGRLFGELVRAMADSFP